MASIIIMPKQGLLMEEGTLTKWLVEEGGKLKINVHNLLTGKIMDTFTFAPRKRRRSRLQ